MTEGARRELINHLIDLKFHNAGNDEEGRLYTGRLPVYHDSDEAINAVGDYHKAIEEFVEELHRLPTAELEQRYAELEPNIEKAEQERFFNQPYANADYAHWSRIAGWSIDEATALLLGKAPEKVNWESVEQYALVSAFAKQYMEIRHLAQRAKERKQFRVPMLPGVCLAWANENGINCPPELEVQVKAHGHVVALEQLAKQKPSGEKALPAKERDSLLKLVVGMAIQKYGYDPTAKRNEATAKIRDDLDRLDIALNDDTIRKYLKEGSELVPSDIWTNRDD